MTPTFSGIGKSARVKKKNPFPLLLILLMLFCGCGKTPVDSPKTDPMPTEPEELVFSGESLPLIAAQNGFCANENLYFPKWVAPVYRFENRAYTDSLL